MKSVSVIIPIYNVEEYLEECLISVVNQTLKNIEIICVNDGTPDNSMEIVDKYAKDDDRIVIINKENGGLSSARNAGIEAAKGEYIYFLDSDDYIKEETLECLYKEAKEQDLDTIYFDAESFFETEELAEKESSYVTYYKREPLYNEVASGQRLFAKMVLDRKFRPSACLQINRTELLREHNIRFKEGIIHEDNLFSAEVTLFAKRARHMAESFYQRRVREESIMTSSSYNRSAYGYFVGLRTLIPKVAENVADEELFAIYMKHLGRMRNNAANALRKIPLEELEPTNLEAEEELWFQYMVRDYANLLRDRDIKNAASRKTIIKLKRKNKQLKKRVKRLESTLFYRIKRALVGVARRCKNGMKKLIKRMVFWVAPKYYAKRFVKISIITPVYNAKKYLAEGIESLRKQTLQDIEVIYVDDQSTDGSYEILKKYAKKDKRIRVFQQEHLGAGQARNLGIKYARGKYVLFLDCDDYFYPDLCKKAYEKIQKHNAQAVLFGAERIDMQTGIKQKMGWVLRSGELPKNKAFSSKDISGRFFQVTSNCPWSKMFRKDFVLKHGLQFQDTKHANDTYFIRSALALAERIVVVDEVLVTYRYNEGNNTQSIKHLAPLEFYKAFVAVKERLEKEGLFETFKHSYINWILTEAIFNYETMKDENAKKIIKEKLCSDGFEILGVKGCTRKDVDSAELYEKYLALYK